MSSTNATPGKAGKKAAAKTSALRRPVGRTPPQQEIATLVALYNEGRNADVEFLAREMTKNYPQYAFGWKVLGVVLGFQGRNDEALISKQKAVDLAPGDFEAHNNLGMTLRDLGRPAEALASVRRALKIKPNYAEGLNNLGSIYLDKNGLTEAEASFRRAVKIDPRQPFTHNNLGLTLMDQGRHEEADPCYRKALELKPNYIDCLINLAANLHHQGKLTEAKSCVCRALELNPNSTLGQTNLGNILFDLYEVDQAQIAYQRSFAIAQDNHGMDAAVWLATLHWLEGDIEKCQRIMNASKQISETTHAKHISARIYWNYLFHLVRNHLQTANPTENVEDLNRLYVMGDSHCLSAHRVVVRYRAQKMRCSAEWIQGCKQWHLGNDRTNNYKAKFELRMARLPRHSTILLTIGEIDCRADEGIVSVLTKAPDKKLEDVVLATTSAYIAYVAKINVPFGHRIIVGGVPATNTSLDPLTIAIIRTFNTTLKQQALTAGMDFLDVYALTDRGDGIASGDYHIDKFHLLPSTIEKAFDKHCIDSNEAWRKMA